MQIPIDLTARSPATDLLNALSHAMRPRSADYWRLATGVAWLPSPLPGGGITPGDGISALADLQRQAIADWTKVAEASLSFWSTPNPWAVTRG